MPEIRGGKENAELVRINPISGPGVCGAEYPLKVAALGEASGSFGFADDLRPPADRQRAALAGFAAASARAPPPLLSRQFAAPAGLWRASNGPISLSAPGVAQEEDDRPSRRGHAGCSNRRDGEVIPATGLSAARSRAGALFGTSGPPPLPRLGPAQGNSVAAVRSGRDKPAATLACPIVSALDRWLADSVQPAAMRWFGTRVVEIKQISAYSCRGMNGNSRAHISEHAFGNALDIASFTLADGRRITVKNGWKGMPEEQGFCATCRPPRASSSIPCWRRAPTSIITITFTST